MLANRLLPMLGLLDDYQGGAFAYVPGEDAPAVPPGRIVRGIAQAVGVRRGRAFVPGVVRGDSEAVGVVRGRTN